MDLIIRPVNDRFLEDVVFPAFEVGMLDAQAALARLLPALLDEHTHGLVETLLQRGVSGALRDVDADDWREALYRLLFWKWVQGPEGWRTAADSVGHAGNWQDTVHLALMLEQPRYPYWDEQESGMLLEACIASPTSDLGLAAFLGGLWEPAPRFAPHEVLEASRAARGVYKAGAMAIADWSYRPSAVVSLWNQQLSNKLGRLLKREEVRLRPLEVPEAPEVLNYWLGKQPEPPMLAVAFSGLGERAIGWIREIGTLVRLVRSSAARGLGLIAVVSAPSGPSGPIQL